MTEQFDPAFALVDVTERVIRKDPDTESLAIFDTRDAALDAEHVHRNTTVKPVAIIAADELARLRQERDSACRERDEHLARAERLEQKWFDDASRMRAERDELRGRVAEWHEIIVALPEDAHRVLVYTPPEMCADPSHAYRIVDAQFVRILTDATHWTYLTPPDTEAQALARRAREGL